MHDKAELLPLAIAARTLFPMAVRVGLLVFVVACSGESRHSSETASPASPTVHGHAPLAQSDSIPISGRYHLRFGGADIGVAEITLRNQAGGYQYRRDDRLVVYRDQLRLESSHSLVIDADVNLNATQVRIRSQVGDVVRTSSATRDAGGWAIRDQGGRLRRLSGLPLAELAFLRATRFDDTSDREDRSSIALVAGASFALVELDVSRRSRSSLDISIRSDLGAAHYTLFVDGDGLPNRWTSDVGETGQREIGMTETHERSLEPSNLLALAAMTSRGRHSLRLRVRGANRELPPSIANQRVKLDGDDWLIDFDRQKPFIPTDLAALVIAVDQQINNDLSVPGLGASDALQMGRGDCTGHATALAMLAEQNGYQVKIATGYRRIGHRWVRHRWVIAKVGRRWVSLDPSFGEPSPESSQLLILSTHSASADDVALADLVTFAGMSNASAQFE